jgi:hypothetical protein
MEAVESQAVDNREDGIAIVTRNKEITPLHHRQKRSFPIEIARNRSLRVHKV